MRPEALLLGCAVAEGGVELLTVVVSFGVDVQVTLAASQVELAPQPHQNAVNSYGT
jgi:hypothetical protein